MCADIAEISCLYAFRLSPLLMLLQESCHTPHSAPACNDPQATSKSCALAANELTMVRLFDSGQQVVGQDKLPLTLLLPCSSHSSASLSSYSHTHTQGNSIGDLQCET